MIKENLIHNMIDNIKACSSKNDFDVCKSQLNDIFSDLTKNIRSIPSDQKAQYGKKINELKALANQIINDKSSEFLNLKDDSVNDNYFLPVPSIEYGRLHPISVATNRLYEIFSDMGFQHVSAYEIESEYYNFDALNIYKNHPARSSSDTFYIDQTESSSYENDQYSSHKNIQSSLYENAHSYSENLSSSTLKSKGRLSLRTQTSNAQIHVLEELGRNIEKKIKIMVMNQELVLNESNDVARIMSSGKVYRSDHDATHTPMFHQIEGFAIGKNITLANLKWCLERFCYEFFQSNDIKIRMRSSYFPFTEPSIEVDVGCRKKNGKLEMVMVDDDKDHDWLEVLGSGMIHPNVLRNCDIDSSKFSGFAWGVGIERMTMLMNDIPTLNNFYGKIDVRWLKNYGGVVF